MISCCKLVCFYYLIYFDLTLYNSRFWSCLHNCHLSCTFSIYFFLFNTTYPLLYNVVFIVYWSIPLRPCLFPQVTQAPSSLTIKTMLMWVLMGPIWDIYLGYLCLWALWALKPPFLIIHSLRPISLTHQASTSPLGNYKWILHQVTMSFHPTLFQ